MQNVIVTHFCGQSTLLWTRYETNMVITFIKIQYIPKLNCLNLTTTYHKLDDGTNIKEDRKNNVRAFLNCFRFVRVGIIQFRQPHLYLIHILTE